MGWKETLNQMSSQIYERLGNEWEAARDTMAQTFDLRLRTGEMIYPRDTSYQSQVHQDLTQETKQPDVEPER